MTTARLKRAAVIPVTAREATDFNELSWTFLNSEFAREPYEFLSIEHRLDAFLRHHGMHDLLNDGTAYDDLLDSVIANIATALRGGIPGVGATRPDHGVSSVRTEPSSS
jgi:hypothetical protein